MQQTVEADAAVGWVALNAEDQYLSSPWTCRYIP
jgi:hypothetical protein